MNVIPPIKFLSFKYRKLNYKYNFNPLNFLINYMYGTITIKVFVHKMGVKKVLENFRQIIYPITGEYLYICKF